MYRISKNLLAITIIMFVAPWPAKASADDAPLDSTADLSRMEQRLERLRSRYNAPGVAVVVVQDGNIVLLKGLGLRGISDGQPVTPDTVFPIASVTKQFTAALVGIHAGAGRLHLAHQPGQYVSGLRFFDPALDRQVTVADLLSHRSGIGNVDATHVFFPTRELSAHLRRLQFLQPNSGYRERFDYSNMGYAVVAGIVERVGGRSWQQQIHALLFDPLGMTRSSTDLASLHGGGNVATGYAMAQGQPFAVLYEDQHEAAPSGGINSTARDLGQWLSMLLADGQFGGQQVVPESFLAEAFSAHVMVNPTYNPRTRNLFFDGYGYGWFTGQFEGRYRVSHGGNTSGFTARIDMLPGDGIGVAILTNQQSSELPRYVADMIYRELLGLPERAIDDYPLQITDGTRPPDVTVPAVTIPAGRSADDYTGVYVQPGYGSFTVFEDGNNLFVRFPAFVLALDHVAQDVFRTRKYYEMHQNTPDFPVVFTSDSSGAISGAEIPFQSRSVRFERQVADE